MSAMRFILLGGFLGAGKTTTIARLAEYYQQQGLNVGIVTNDQAAELVDTENLRSQGFHVGEVAGACFCCNFDELTNTIQRLAADKRPDVILAEPVGSCTDLVATVIQPIMHLYGGEFDVAPYGVILKPSHGRKILRGEQQGGFSPQAEYIFRKQLEEADFIIINRIDELSAADVDDLAGLIVQQHPAVPVLRMSAKTGAGFETLLEMLDQRGSFGARILDLDYDIYAEGEAELGWLNSNVQILADEPMELDNLLLDVVRRLQTSLAGVQAETAHLKVIGLSDGSHAVVNLVSSDTPAELSIGSGLATRTADVIVNARVAIAPELLEQFVDEAITNACQLAGARAETRQIRSLRPGRPVPTHRYAKNA